MKPIELLKLLIHKAKPVLCPTGKLNLHISPLTPNGKPDTLWHCVHKCLSVALQELSIVRPKQAVVLMFNAQLMGEGAFSTCKAANVVIITSDSMT